MAKKKRERDPLRAIADAFGIPAERDLDLAAPMQLDVSRLGYEGEGLRLTMSIDCPYHFSSELQLSRADAEWLIARLRIELDSERHANMPKGRP